MVATTTRREDYVKGKAQGRVESSFVLLVSRARETDLVS